jgi:hypothetical protein
LPCEPQACITPERTVKPRQGPVDDTEVATATPCRTD